MPRPRLLGLLQTVVRLTPDNRCRQLNVSGFVTGRATCFAPQKMRRELGFNPAYTVFTVTQLCVQAPEIIQDF
eukprot:10524953-Karenia_brevis.AAC.1